MTESDTDSYDEYDEDEEIETVKPEVLPPEPGGRFEYNEDAVIIDPVDDFKPIELDISERELGIAIGGIGMALVGLGAWLLFIHNKDKHSNREKLTGNKNDRKMVEGGDDL